MPEIFCGEISGASVEVDSETRATGDVFGDTSEQCADDSGENISHASRCHAGISSLFDTKSFAVCDHRLISFENDDRVKSLRETGRSDFSGISALRRVADRRFCQADIFTRVRGQNCGGGA